MNLVFGLTRRDDLDEAGQIAGGAERLFRPLLLDGAGDAARLLFFTEKTEDADQIADLRTIDDIGRRNAGTRHAHVERAIFLEGKTALGLVDLHGGNADIQHDAIEPALRGMFREIGELRLDEAQPAAIGGNHRLTAGDRGRIAVERDDISALIEDCLGIAAGAERAVENDLAG